MNSRSFFALALVAALAVAPPAWAQGQGNGNGQGNGGASENGQSNGSENGKKEEAPGQTGHNSGAPSVAGPGANAGGELSESDVLAAVEAGRAVSLSTILPDIRNRTGGEVINAQLQQAGAFMLYAVTVLTPAGKVTTEYYYARSGRHVER